jgi:serine protease Do
MAYSKRFIAGFSLLTLGLGSVVVSSSITTATTTPQSPNQEVLDKASNTFKDISKKATPAVVSISAVKPPEEDGPAGGGLPFPFHDPSTPSVGIGSGIIIRPDGTILTNNHVVENALRVTVSLDGKNKEEAEVVGTDPKTDLAVVRLKNPRKNMPILAFGDSSRLETGDWAIAVGSPFGLSQSVSFGIISAKGRGHMGILDIEDFIQTDAAINPGSSGGPLLNSRGEVIGVNTAIFSQGGGFMGIGFAVPSSIAKEVSEQIIAHGKVKRGWVGLVAQDLNPGLASFFKAPSQAKGALVADVVPNGPASKARLKQGDVIVRYRNEAVNDAGHLRSLVAKAEAGARIPVEVSRRGRMMTLDIQVSEQPAPPAKPRTQLAGTVAAEGGVTAAGLAVEDIPSEIADHLKLPSRRGAMVISVSPGSPAFEAGLAPGDVILSVNEKPMTNAVEVRRAIRTSDKSKTSTVFYVQRGPSDRVYVPLDPVKKH